MLEKNRKMDKAKEAEAIQILYRDYLLVDTANIGPDEKAKKVISPEAFANTLKDYGFITNEVLLPMGYISLSEYCKKYGYDKRKIRRILTSGKVHGIMKDGTWYLDGNVPVKDD